jgi:hypothetical protein
MFARVSGGMRLVGKCLKKFLYLDLGQVVYGNGEIYPKPCAFFRAQEINNF